MKICSLLNFKQNNFIILNLFFLLIFYGCNESYTEKVAESISSDDNNFIIKEESETEAVFFSVNESTTLEIDESTVANSEKKKPASFNRKLIKTGEIKFESQDIHKSRIQIEKLIKKHQAFISNEQSSNYSSQTEQSLSIRIPFEKFDLFIKDLSGTVEKFEYKNIQVKDVTEEYIDIQSRLKAKYKLEESFLVLLKKALKIKDILEIEKELNYVRSEIERMEGRLRLLKDQVSLSTLHITFYKYSSIEYKSEKGFFSKLWYNFQSGFSGILQFILDLVSIWPFITIALIITIIIRKFWKNKKKKK